ncbi:Protein SHORT-ROOT [Glycine soja]|nr:Protein SHORT-ROOT [Glycine soja]
MWMLNKLSSPYDDTDQKLASYFLQTFFSHITQAGDRTYKTLASASKKTCSFKSTHKTCSFVTAATTAQKVMKEIKARMEKEADLDIGLEGFEFVKGFEECLRWFRVYFEALDRIFPRTSNEHLMLEREAGRAMVDLVACSLVESVERWGVWVFYGSTGG